MIFSAPFLAQAADAASQPGVVDGLKGTFSGIAERMGVEGPLLFSQAVLFFIVAFTLKHFAYEPILKLLDQRQAVIKESLENAAKVKEELAAAQAKYAEIVRDANAKANGLVEEAKKTADLQGQKLLQEAHAAAEAHIANARALTEQEREKMLRELKNEVLRLVVAATGRATGKVLTAADQERIKEETLAAATAAGRN